jgi:hypothetical protein
MRPQSNTSPEEWRSVIGYEGWYEVSSCGRVRRVASACGTCPGRILKATLSRPNGYVRISLSRCHRSRSAWVHRLVAEAFLEPQPIGHQMNHRNGIKTDNRVGNLEWATPLTNLRHARDMGLLNPSRGELNGQAKLRNEDIPIIRAARGKISGCEMARRYGVSEHTIRCVLNGWTWRHV